MCFFSPLFVIFGASLGTHLRGSQNWKEGLASTRAPLPTTVPVSQQLGGVGGAARATDLCPPSHLARDAWEGTLLHTPRMGLRGH